MPTPSLFAGVDRREFPASPPEFLRALALHSNVDWVAMYLQPAPNAGLGRRRRNGSRSDDRGWMTQVPQLRLEGFGVLPVWMGEQGKKVIQRGLSMDPSTTHGKRDAAAAAVLLRQAGFEVGAVVYLDIEMVEDSSAVEEEVLEYLEAFSREIVAQGFRAGLYTPFQMARALSARWPMIAAWVVNGTWRVKPLQGDRSSPAVTIDPLQRRRVEVVVARPEIAHSRRFRKPRQSATDRDDNRLDFPLAWQYRLDFRGTIPVLRTPAGVRSQPGPASWDFSASIVRDPSFPACEPRLASVDGRDEVVGLGSLPPLRDASESPLTQGRVGELWLPLPSPPSPASLPPESGTGQRLHPWARPSVAPDPQGGLAVAVLLEDQTPAIFTVPAGGGRRWTKAESPALASRPPMRPLSGVRLVGFGDRLCLVGISADTASAGTVLISRRAPDGRWEELRPMGGAAFRAHPLSGLALSTRSADSIDAFVVGADGRLRTLWWSRWDVSWPGENIRAIGGNGVELHPQTPVVAAASAKALDVFVIGRDGRLYTTSWAQGSDWTDFTALGDASFRPFPLARPGVAVRGDRVSTDLFVVDSSGHLTTLWRPGGRRDWEAGNMRRIGGEKLFPHLLTDIAARSPSPDSLEITLVAHDGQPVRTQWSTRQDWTDFAPVNLPAFSSPEH